MSPIEFFLSTVIIATIVATLVLGVASYVIFRLGQKRGPPRLGDTNSWRELEPDNNGEGRNV
jgi:hypothetical protein